MYIVTEKDLRLLRQRNKTWRVKIEILNKRFQVLETIQGETIDLSCKIDSSSDMRRTCSMTVHVLNSSYTIDDDAYFWLDKYVKVSYGLYDAVYGDFAYYPLGIYLLNDNSYSYTASSRTLSLSLVDMMAMTTDIRGSAIGADSTVVEVNSRIRNAMIATLVQLVGYGKYRICDFPAGQVEVPYDLEFDVGVYPYEILTKLRDLYPCYEMYFDVDGTFVCDAVPSHVDDPVALDASVMDALIIEESRSVSFSKIKNVTEIWGQELDADRTADTCTAEGDVYKLTIEGVTVLDDGVSYCFTPPSANVADMKVQINSLTVYPIKVHRYDAGGVEVAEALDAGVMRAGLPYVVRYTEGVFYYYGELNVHGIAMAMNAEPTDEQKAEYEQMFDCHNIRYVVNPEDKFAVERLGIIRQVFTGSEYADIYTSELATERAAYENWKSTRLQDEITLDAILVPWLDVNRLIEYTSPLSGQKVKAIVNSVDIRVDAGTMSLGLTKFYPYYPW